MTTRQSNAEWPDANDRRDVDAPGADDANANAEDFFGEWDGDDDGGEGRLVRFAREYGWRAYAIPVLAVLTLLVVVNMFQNPGSPVVDAAGSEGHSERGIGAAGQDSSSDEGDVERKPAELPEGEQNALELPPGGPIAEAGEGTYREVGAPGANGGNGDELTLRYVVEVENGVDTNPYGGDQAVAEMVDATLLDPRSWTNDPRFRFEHVSGADNPDVKIRLTSLKTAQEMCGMELDMETSCRTMITGDDTVVLNEARWVRGAAPFEGDLGRYRQYMINHEVGHALGFASHEPCPADGALAPVMMQQTLSLNNGQLHSFDPEEVYPDNPDTCLANPWPYPRPAAS